MKNVEKEYSNEPVSQKFNLLIAGSIYMILTFTFIFILLVNESADSYDILHDIITTTTNHFNLLEVLLLGIISICIYCLCFKFTKNINKKNLMMTSIVFLICIFFITFNITFLIFTIAKTNLNISEYGEMKTTKVSMFNNGFYRYANNDDTIRGSRAKELYNHAIEYNVDVIFHNESGDIIGNVSGDSIIENIKDRGKYKISYNYDFNYDSFSIEAD